MLKKYVIVGSGKFCREVCSWISDKSLLPPDFISLQIKGILDNNNILKNFKIYDKVPYLGQVESYVPQEDELFICAIGNPKIKKQLCTLLESKGATFFNVIHSSAVISKINVNLGNGVIIGPNTVISNNVTIGDHSTINTLSSVGHDVTIGKYCQINVLVNLAGGVQVQDEATINSSSCILPEITIGKEATVGAGAVVLSSVAEATTVFGNPARAISKH